MFREKAVELGKKVKTAFNEIKIYDTRMKNSAILKIAEMLDKNRENILKANSLDVQNSRNTGTRESLIDRLRLDDARIDGMIESCRIIAKLPDPIGQEISSRKREDGLLIRKIRVPLGPLGIIYESRPNVTVDTAVLALKAGNTVLLKGGSDAFETNSELVKIIRGALLETGFPEDCVVLVPFKEREAVEPILHLKDELVLLIPRGGKGLIDYVRKNATVPVLETGTGNCHIFVDKSAKTDESVNVIINAKTQKPGACNAVEKVLVHEEIARDFLPFLISTLRKSGVRVKGCRKTIEIVEVEEAFEEDWETEYLDFILAVKTVSGLEEAVNHINRYSSGHSEAILTNDLKNAEEFCSRIDSAALYVNASTRFTDGGEFGFGAEMGISTQRLFARGPVGLEELTTYKYVIQGYYHIRKG